MDISKLHNKYFYIFIGIFYFAISLLINHLFDIYPIKRALIQSTIGSIVTVVILHLIIKHNRKSNKKNLK
ncbi:MAG: hypothetical protein A2X64_02165 [Ignavibacteria bacterium GWF2_33_9]|nr:MAG: hypothetical protein A2X64_02165 [Ignavibacteria bacterium GWF2_33_9]